MCQTDNRNFLIFLISTSLHEADQGTDRPTVGVKDRADISVSTMRRVQGGFRSRASFPAINLCEQIIDRTGRPGLPIAPITALNNLLPVPCITAERLDTSVTFVCSAFVLKATASSAGSARIAPATGWCISQQGGTDQSSGSRKTCALTYLDDVNNIASPG